MSEFTPTYFWNNSRKELTVVLTQEQATAALYLANIPTDNSEQAQWARKFLSELHSLRLNYISEFGECTLIIAPRKYHGEPV